MVNTRSGHTGRKSGYEARIKSPTKETPQPQGEPANQDLRQMLVEMVNQNREQIKIIKLFEKSIKSLTRREATKEKSYSYKTFLSCSPPELQACTNPIVIMRWINEMEHTFHCCECSELQKVNYAVRMLKGRAWEWWNMSRKFLDKEIVFRVKWDAFKWKLMSENVSQKDMDKVKEEFCALKKGDLTVHEYACQFVEKMELGGDTDEEAKVNRFAMGLPWDYRHSVRHATTLSKAIQETKDVEDTLPTERQKRILGEKKKW